MPIKDYSTTAGSNTSVDGVNIAEGCLPGNVNNAMRAIMADTRSFYQSGGWIDLGYTYTYASGTSFTISSDVTAFYPVGLRVRAVGATTGTIYGEITASSYSAPNTTLTVSWDSGSLQSETLTISRSFMTVTGSPVSTGDVTGPASSTDNAVALFDGTGGKTLKNGVPIGVAAGNIQQVDQANTNTASASTTNLGTTLQHTITGTTTITAFGGVAGNRYEVVFSGALTLTHNASSLILPGGANITTAAGDQAEIYMITASTCRVKYTKASGQPVAATSTVTRVTEVSASGSAVDFTSIPSNANSITLSFSDVSLDSTGNILVQLGDSGGVETTGYDSGSQRGGSTTVDTSTSGFILSMAGASNVAGGNMTLQRMGDYRWSEDHGARVTGLGVAVGGGIKNLSDTLTTVRVTTTSGNFDGGLIGLSYTTE